MSPGDVFLLIQPIFFLAILACGWRWNPLRRSQEKAMAQILAANPDAEQFDEILPLQSSWRSGKQREIDCRVRELQASGWTYLKMSEVSPWISLRYWGGAVRLHFLRTITPETALNS